MGENPLSADLDRVLLRTRPLWEELRGRRLFVTGGTGFFGCWLLESFAWANQELALGAEMVVLTRNLERFQKKAPHLAARPDIKFHIGDARDFNFPAGPFSHVLHAATDSVTKPGEDDPALMFDTIVTGSRRVLEFAAQSGAKKFLLTSSGAGLRRPAAGDNPYCRGLSGRARSFDSARRLRGRQARQRIALRHSRSPLRD